MTEEEFRKKSTPRVDNEGRRKIIKRCEESGYDSAITAVMQFFHYEHLPPELAVVSEPFYRMAFDIAGRAPHSRETTVSLRKLLEAKDAAVRAVLPE